MSKIIIGIHGLANKPNRITIKKWWRNSILEGLKVNRGTEKPSLRFEMVFWADLLYKHQQHNDLAFNFDKLYNNEPYLEAKEGKLKEYKEKVMDHVRAKLLGLLGSGIDLLKSKIDFDSLGNWLLKKTMKDLAFYYDDDREIKNRSGNMQVANKVLKDELINVLKQHKDKEIMLIAHSMGSIIAYDVLRDLGQQSNNDIFVKHFITIGSPLGLPYVKDKITDQRQYDKRSNKVRTPSIVTGDWKNYADKKDKVALDYYLEDDFDANDNGIKVKDDLVKNDYIGLTGKSNHHKSYGYLRTPELSRHITDFIASGVANL